jgi:hypothetical protein
VTVEETWLFWVAVTVAPGIGWPPDFTKPLCAQIFAAPLTKQMAIISRLSCKKEIPLLKTFANRRGLL